MSMSFQSSKFLVQVLFPKSFSLCNWPRYSYVKVPLLHVLRPTVLPFNACWWTLHCMLWRGFCVWSFIMCRTPHITMMPMTQSHWCQLHGDYTVVWPFMCNFVWLRVCVLTDVVLAWKLISMAMCWRWILHSYHMESHFAVCIAFWRHSSSKIYITVMSQTVPVVVCFYQFLRLLIFRCFLSVNW